MILSTYITYTTLCFKKSNTFVDPIAECEYIKPQFAVDTLREKLQRINLTINDETIKERQWAKNNTPK